MCGKALPFRKLLPFTSPRLSLGETSFIHASGKAQPYRTSGGGAEETSSLINDSSHQIVLLSLGDQDIYHLARDRYKVFRRVVDKNATVDIRRLGFHSSLPKQVALGGFAFKYYADLLANHRFVFSPGNLRLFLHQTS